MIGIVVVSHSRALARAAIDLALGMASGPATPTIVAAGGLDDDTLGTDAVAISAALAEADAGDGVLVLMDLGSAILSTEMALEFADPDAAARVRLTPAPLVEGLVAAVVAAESGADLDACEAEALRGLEPKQAHLGGESAPTAAPAGEHRDETVLVLPMELPHGLHARPAAAIVAALAGLDVLVHARDAAAADDDEVDGRSAMGLLGLGLRQGDALRLRLSGPDAASARDVLAALAARNFDDHP